MIDLPATSSSLDALEPSVPHDGVQTQPPSHETITVKGDSGLVSSCFNLVREVSEPILCAPRRQMQGQALGLSVQGLLRAASGYSRKDTRLNTKLRLGGANEDSPRVRVRVRVKILDWQSEVK